MSAKTISELSTLESLNDDDLLLVSSGGVTYNTTVSDMADMLYQEEISTITDTVVSDALSQISGSAQDYGLSYTDDFKSAISSRSGYVVVMNGMATLYMYWTMAEAGTLPSDGWTIATLPRGMHPAGNSRNYAANAVQASGCICGVTVNGTADSDGNYNIVLWPWGGAGPGYVSGEVFMFQLSFPVEYDAD